MQDSIQVLMQTSYKVKWAELWKKNIEMWFFLILIFKMQLYVLGYLAIGAEW